MSSFVVRTFNNNYQLIMAVGHIEVGQEHDLDAVANLRIAIVLAR